DELARVRERLAERTIRWILLDGIFVNGSVWPNGNNLHLASHKRDRARAQELRGLRHMDVDLHDHHLDRERDHCQRKNRDAGEWNSARCRVTPTQCRTPSGVTIADHPIRKLNRRPTHVTSRATSLPCLVTAARPINIRAIGAPQRECRMTD